MAPTGGEFTDGHGWGSWTRGQIHEPNMSDTPTYVIMNSDGGLEYNIKPDRIRKVDVPDIEFENGEGVEVMYDGEWKRVVVAHVNDNNTYELIGKKHGLLRCVEPEWIRKIELVDIRSIDDIPRLA